MADRKKKPLMATSSKASSTKSDSGVSATLRGGSEELFDLFCQSCSKDNVHLEAAGYCQTCQEYLCDTCCKYHRKTTATQHHKLLDKADMPKSRMAVKSTDDLIETCPKHPGKLLEHFCNSHIELCCIVCLKMDHGSCKVISHIPDVSDGTARSAEYNTLMTDLKALVSKLTKQQAIIKISAKDNDGHQSESLAGIREFRKEFDKLQDKYEENSVMQVTKLHHDNSEKIKAAESECQTMLSDLTAIIAGLDAKAKGGQNNQLFVDINLSRQRLSDMEAKTSDVTDCIIIRYSFYQDVNIREILSTLSAVWSLSIRTDGKETNARYIGEVNVKTDGDTDDCNIVGVAVLPGGDVVTTDRDNKALKLVNMKLNKVTSRQALSSIPLDLTNTKPNQVAVSLPQEGGIEIYTVTDVLTKHETINVGDRDFDGMCYADDRFMLTYITKGLVKIVDMSGRVLRTISTDKNGDRLFISPNYIAVGRDGDVVYVTDEKAHTVTTMTLSGHVISVYKNDKLNTPRGVTVGPDHKVYVCSSNTDTVHELSATGEFEQVLLDEQRGLPEHPRAIAYDDTIDRLYISNGSKEAGPSNYVKFFQIEGINIPPI